MTDENANKLRNERLERLRNMQLRRQDNIDNPKNIIMKAVQSEYKDVDKQEAEKMTRELVLAPGKSTIKIGNRDVPVADLRYNIALSIEAMGAETSSEQEYFSWFTESSEIMQHMNDGVVTEEDLKERNDWIENSFSSSSA